MADRGARSDGVAVGIDLGTTHSVVSAYKAGKRNSISPAEREKYRPRSPVEPEHKKMKKEEKDGHVEVFANDCGSRTTPSIVGFMDWEAYIGDAAKDLPPTSQIYDAKRLIGRSWQDDAVQRGRESWPFQVVEEKGTPRMKFTVSGREETFAPEQVGLMSLDEVPLVGGSTPIPNLRSMLRDLLGDMELRSSINPDEAVQAGVDVTFEISAEGLLTVTAVEPTTRTRKRVAITASEAHLSEKDIVGMIETAKRFQRVDEEELVRKKRKL